MPNKRKKKTKKRMGEEVTTMWGEAGDEEVRSGAMTIVWNNSDCRADTCLRPKAEVEWVACDGCGEWFHQPCLGISEEQAATLDQVAFFCTPCQEAREQEEVGEGRRDTEEDEEHPGDGEATVAAVMDHVPGMGHAAPAVVCVSSSSPPIHLTSSLPPGAKIQ